MATHLQVRATLQPDGPSTPAFRNRCRFQRSAAHTRTCRAVRASAQSAASRPPRGIPDLGPNVWTHAKIRLVRQFVAGYAAGPTRPSRVTSRLRPGDRRIVTRRLLVAGEQSRVPPNVASDPRWVSSGAGEQSRRAMKSLRSPANGQPAWVSSGQRAGGTRTIGASRTRRDARVLGLDESSRGAARTSKTCPGKAVTATAPRTALISRAPRPRVRRARSHPTHPRPPVDGVRPASLPQQPDLLAGAKGGADLEHFPRRRGQFDLAATNPLDHKRHAVRFEEDFRRRREGVLSLGLSDEPKLLVLARAARTSKACPGKAVSDRP